MIPTRVQLANLIDAEIERLEREHAELEAPKAARGGSDIDIIDIEEEEKDNRENVVEELETESRAHLTNILSYLPHLSYYRNISKISICVISPRFRGGFFIKNNVPRTMFHRLF